MRTIVIGFGVQGAKRKRVASDAVVAVVDPFSGEATYSSVEDVPLDHYKTALVCTPDEAKFPVLHYLLQNKKHVLVEKPLLFEETQNIKDLMALCDEHKVTCYTAYNHRFEPHFVKMKEILDSGVLGKIYNVSLFYGNGTARLVRQSPWRDQGYGVLADLGSHLLDTFLFWFDRREYEFSIVKAHRFENKAFDHLIFTSQQSEPSVQCELSLLSWRNHFTADIYGEEGSAHISSLCKWGPSILTLRKRILPSGRPSEESFTLIQEDPTWQEEYKYFKKMCEQQTNNLSNDLWIQERLQTLFSQTQQQEAKHVA
jgi:scyllo-inositol 2-dehydrogenase (NADP+)